MKIIFAGTPPFAAAALQALLTTKHELVAVLTQPDRPAGRGMQFKPSPVKLLAIQNGIPVLQPSSLKATEVQQHLKTYHADVMIVAAYGLILPPPVLQIPKLGCLNIHASLLPRWRGAAPIQRAILAGDTETGITIMQMDEGLDTGAMLLKKMCPISEQDTAQTLHDKLEKLGAEAIVETMVKLEQGKLIGEMQDSKQATYAAKIVKTEANLNWSQSALELQRAIRAYNPVPVAYSTLNGMTIKIWQASEEACLVDMAGRDPGSVLTVNNSGIHVACGKGMLVLQVLQRPGGKPLPAVQFTQGVAVKAGDRFTII